MPNLEVFQNGVFSNTREPVFQIGSKQADGTYEVVVFSLMNRAEAEAKLNELQPPVIKKKEAPKKVAPKKAAKLRIPFKAELESMTKVELEKEMRRHGLELDRRETKDALIKQSVTFLKRR